MKPNEQKKKYTYRAGDEVSPTPGAPERGSLYRQEVSRKTAPPQAEPPASHKPAPPRESAPPEVFAEPPASYKPAPPRESAPPEVFAEPPASYEPAPPLDYAEEGYDGKTSYTEISAYADYTQDAAPAPAHDEPEYNEFGYGEYAAAQDAGDGGGDYGEIISRKKNAPAYDIGYFSQDAGQAGKQKRSRDGAPRAPKAKSARRREAGGYGAAQLSIGRRVGRSVGRVFAVIGVVLAAIVVLAFGAITIICKSGFPTVREKFVVSVTETSAVKWLANIYFSPEEVEEILAANAVLPPEETTDTTTPFETNVTEETKQDIEVVDIKGATYVGKLMIVNDPTRIRLATLPAFGADIDGKKVEDFVAENNAVGGINAGGFLDLNGMGRGGQPLGMLIKDGVIRSGSANTVCNMIGFTAEGQLLVGSMSGQEALDKGMVDGVFFEPTLIVNGQPAEVSGNGGGLNPRTVIGQRDDGAILMLVIDGRQPHSLGASLQDCMQEMLDAGAVNASNLDGGSSSVMIYEGEMINTCASLYGSRGQPACWIIQ